MYNTAVCRASSGSYFESSAVVVCCPAMSGRLILLQRSSSHVNMGPGSCPPITLSEASKGLHRRIFFTLYSVDVSSDTTGKIGARCVSLHPCYHAKERCDAPQERRLLDFSAPRKKPLALSLLTYRVRACILVLAGGVGFEISGCLYQMVVFA